MSLAELTTYAGGPAMTVTSHTAAHGVCCRWFTTNHKKAISASFSPRILCFAD